MKYSQNNEEQIIKDYFKGYTGTFVDIGANDGITLSNTRALIESGWSGIMIEPSPTAFNKLKNSISTYPNVFCYQYAIVPKRSPKEMILNDSTSLLNQNDTSLVSTLVPEEMERFKSVVQYTPVKVKTFTWATARNRWKYKTFDLLSLDIEGMDLQVLEEIDLTGFKMVIVEWNGKNKERFVELCAGFNLIHENGENLIFAK